MTRLLLVLTISFISCKSQTGKTNPLEEAKDPISVIQENEKKSAEKENNNLGELVSTISFKVKTNNKKDFKDGFIPWASIEKPKQDIPYLYEKMKLLLKTQR
ncbi:MAG: hypothetical protein V4685_12670 [Bacteroidota bacterium]